MPRGGSKKGEHRGNAKSRAGIETPNEVMRGVVRMVARPKKPGRGKGDRSPFKTTIEEDILTSQMVHGRKSARDMTPKEIILDNMHAFQTAAYTAKAMQEVFMQTMPAGDERSKIIAQLEVDEERLRRIASDEAYKVMPYVHARKMPTASNGESLGDSIVRTMLDEIDRLNREHPMVIEHIPQKRTA